MARVLWIDDNAGKGTARRMAFDALMYFVEKNGHEVAIASTGAQIEAALTDIERYDLLILDIIMEPLPSSEYNEQYGGIDVLETIATTGRHLPIIMLSVMPARLIRNEANRRGLDLERIGVKEIKRKGSVTPTELATSVEKFLSQRRDDLARGAGC
jgi:CheY-like chemotaxis protein